VLLACGERPAPTDPAGETKVWVRRRENKKEQSQVKVYPKQHRAADFPNGLKGYGLLATQILSRKNHQKAANPHEY